MVDGGLAVYRCERIPGEVVYGSSTHQVRLGGLGYPRKATIPIDVAPPERGDLKAVYLEIGAAVRSLAHVRWRLWVNGKAVTREFKPSAVARVDDGLYTKSVYDVTPLLSGEGPCSRYLVSIYYEGSDHIIVDHVGVLASYRLDDAQCSYMYASGALALAPGDESTIRVSLPEHPEGAEGYLRLVGSVPSKHARIRLLANEREVASISGTVGVEDLELDGLKLSDGDVLKVAHVGSAERYYPRQFVLSSLLIARSAAARPRVEVVEVSAERCDKGVRIRGVLRNVGSGDSPRTLLVVMGYGSPLARLELGELKKGEEREFEAEVRLSKGVHVLTLRAVWSRHGRPDFTERKLKVTV